ncbi:hypothetical protein LIER_41965 [Lithospermum erythrorhizon]|uniref:Uncharacterized protein n=1 Tax=Lithospermum erythrorhizon TaxID=34254 RepID=A0AAV3RKT5_LITER
MCDSSPERSPLRENRSGHKGRVTSQSLYNRTYKDKDTKDHRGELRYHKKHAAPEPLTKPDAGGNSNADLQKQVDELKAFSKTSPRLRTGET